MLVNRLRKYEEQFEKTVRTFAWKMLNEEILYFKGTVSPSQNRLKVVWLDRP